ncbi:MAG TPA: glycosyltransferase family 2 protein [Polyangiaceae bacterium]|nr:glycosyltransferase family 2 protein [Polyangiaceae bacterium]
MENNRALAAFLIVKDEETLLGGCLASIRPWVDEICVLDTGSRDNTVEIALSFGAKVASFVWCEDFAAARNASLAMSRAPWALVIDADERLVADTGPALARATASPDKLAYYVTREDLRPEGPPDCLAIARLFQNRPDIRFRRPVHEGIMDDLVALGAGDLSDSGVRLTHLGYLPEVLQKQDKHGRNLRILAQRLRDAPDDLYNAYKFAVTLPASAREQRRAAFAIAHALAVALTEPERSQLPFLPRLFNAHAAALAAEGALTEALAVADQGMAQVPPSAELMYRRGELARCVGDVEAAVRWLELARLDRHNSLVRADRPHEVAAQSWAALLAIAADAETKLDAPPEQAAADFRVGCALARLAFAQGQVSQGLTRFARLLDSHFGTDEVRLLAGEVAWRQRDFATAESMWKLTTPASHAGHTARAWLALLAVVRNAAVPQLEKPRDFSTAALALLLGRLGGTTVSVDAAMLPDAVWRAGERWRAELTHAGRADLAARK